MNCQIPSGILSQEIDRCIAKIKGNFARYNDKYPAASAEKDGAYKLTDNFGWTTGFWSGQTWLCYELSGNEFFKQKGLEQVASFRQRLETETDIDHHDIGFLYSLSCVAAYKILSDVQARDIAIQAAEYLCKRFTEKGNFIQAWGKMFATDNYRLIIDCYMNLPLLYWAFQETKNSRFKEIADKHAETALITIREDFSTHHTYFFDLATGEPQFGATAQGYADDSPWARGQAWGLYGMALCYRYSQNPVFQKMFVPLTRFFLDHLPSDHVAYWDLTFTSGEQPRDASASAIAACGIMEMLPYLPDSQDKADFLVGMQNMMLSLIQNYASTSEEGLIIRSSYNANPKHWLQGVDVCCSFGDYFYLEALARLKNPSWNPYW